jgi:dTDP-4-amino-4,6-dideoxygalactose transaminase
MNLLQINSKTYGEGREALMQRLEENGVQTRPVWALNHLQRPYQYFQTYQIEKAEEIVAKSLCLPSSTNLQNEDLKNIVGMLS